MRGEKRKDPSVRVSRRRGDEMLVSREMDETMADHGVGGGGGGAFADVDHQAAVDDDLMLGLDGEDLIFSEDTFPALPDFPCLSSPSATPSLSSASTFRAKSAVLSSCSSTSSSSSSASWSFLQVPDGGGVVADMQQQHQAEFPVTVDEMTVLAPSSLFDHCQPSEFSDGLDILGDMNQLFDMSADHWDPASLFHADEASMGVGGAAMASQGIIQPCQLAQEGHLHGHGEGVQQPHPEEGGNSCEELAAIFLEWLRSNKESISPEDLRSIKLKRATIESAARRLGRTKQGRAQLLKLILAWVQNNHLQRKRLRPGAAPFHVDHQPRPFPITSNPTQPDYNYSSTDTNLTPRPFNSWVPHAMDPSTGLQHPASLTAAAFYGNGEMVYPGATAPYPYHHGCGTSSVVVNTQPFNPSPDFVNAIAGPWPAQLATPMPQFAPFPGTASPHVPMSMVPPQYPGGFANQFPGHPMHPQGQPMTSTALTTKEARRKRMARQRRLHHHRNNHNQQPPTQQQHSHHLVVAPAEGAIGPSSHPNARNWPPFWAGMPSSSTSLQVNHILETQNSSNMQQLTPPLAAQPQIKKALLGAVSSSMKRQGWKGEKNLKFLLQKVLKQSDVGSLGRIVLPKKEAEKHLPELDARDGISIPMEDIGTSQVWNMRYRFWPNNKSRMYLLENTGDFVRSNGLQEGDFIVIYSDVKCGKYMIRGVKVRQQAEPQAAASSRKASQKRNASGKMDGTSKMKEPAVLVDEDDDSISEDT